MSYESPSLKDLILSAENGLSVAFYGSTTTLRKTSLKVIAKVFGGVTFLLSLFLREIYKNTFISTCDISKLEAFGSDFGLPHKAAGYARGKVTVSGSVGSVMPAETVFVDDDTGLEYETVVDVTIPDSGCCDISVIATAFGAESNLDAGASLSYRDSAPTGIFDDDTVVVSTDGIKGGVSYTVIVGGATEYWGETAEAYRRRLLSRRQNAPQGGADADYIGWALRFPVVARCFILANYPSTAAVTCVLVGNDGDESINADSLNEITAYMTDDVRRPITADVIVKSCVPVPLSFCVALSPNTQTVRDSARSALSLMLKSFAPGSVLSCAGLTVSLKSLSIANDVSITAINGQSAVTLDKSLAHIPVVSTGSDAFTWSDL